MFVGNCISCVHTHTLHPSARIACRRRKSLTLTLTKAVPPTCLRPCWPFQPSREDFPLSLFLVLILILVSLLDLSVFYQTLLAFGFI